MELEVGNQYLLLGLSGGLSIQGLPPNIISGISTNIFVFGFFLGSQSTGSEFGFASQHVF